jgi:hypothetical protein
MATETKPDILKRRPITPADREAINAIKHAMTLRVRRHKRRGATQDSAAEQLGTRWFNASRSCKNLYSIL